ncbi:MAG: hypothetical protein HYX78_13875 [Armatimonadetes bacterium]|nr:hypothetical protein [Armatimonadota bacterium]
MSKHTLSLVLRGLVAVCALCLGGFPVGATVMYVKTTGSDANDGSNTLVSPGQVDIDREPRIFPEAEPVDIGADEYCAHAVYSPANAKMLVGNGQEVAIKARSGLETPRLLRS